MRCWRHHCRCFKGDMLLNRFRNLLHNSPGRLMSPLRSMRRQIAEPLFSSLFSCSAGRGGPNASQSIISSLRYIVKAGITRKIAEAMNTPKRTFYLLRNHVNDVSVSHKNQLFVLGRVYKLLIRAPSFYLSFLAASYHMDGLSPDSLSHPALCHSQHVQTS